MKRILCDFSRINNNLPVALFKVLFVFTAINAIFLSIGNAFGFNHHFSYVYWQHFVWIYDVHNGVRQEIYRLDLFADYFKYIFSFASAKKLSIITNLDLHPLFREYIINAALRGNGVAQLAVHGVTNLNVLPLGTAYALINLWIMQYISPQIMFFLMICTVVLLLYGIIKKIEASRQEEIIWFFCLLLSYPFIFMLQRGNLMAAYTALFITIYHIFLAQKRSISVSLFVLAIAVNIRPNAIIFIFSLLIFENNKKFICVFYLFSSYIFFHTVVFT